MSIFINDEWDVVITDVTLRDELDRMKIAHYIDNCRIICPNISESDFHYFEELIKSFKYHAPRLDTETAFIIKKDLY